MSNTGGAPDMCGTCCKTSLPHNINGLAWNSQDDSSTCKLSSQHAKVPQFVPGLDWVQGSHGRMVSGPPLFLNPIDLAS